MKIIGICASPKKGGNNEQAIDIALKIAKERGFEVEKLSLAEKKVGFCTACDLCRTTKECSVKDDMQEVYQKLKLADGIIISSPVYMGLVSAQLKALFDRSVALRRWGFLLKNKVGGALAVGMARNGGQEYVLHQIHTWMHTQGMIVVADDDHWGGTLVAPIKDDEFGLKTLKATVGKVCSTLELIKK